MDFRLETRKLSKKGTQTSVQRICILVQYIKVAKSQRDFSFLPNLQKRLKITTLDSGINIGVRLLIFEKKNEKRPQCLVWCKNELKFWCWNFIGGGLRLFKGVRLFQSLEYVQQLLPLHYGQIHYIRGYEKSNLKNLIIGNLYVKICTCFFGKRPEPSQEKYVF